VQIDDHYGELTVRETFDLSARFQSSGYRRAIASEVAAKERELGITPDPEVGARKGSGRGSGGGRGGGGGGEA
jgi:ABC-type multidrug transport system ATPase subunit